MVHDDVIVINAYDDRVRINSDLCRIFGGPVVFFVTRLKNIRDTRSKVLGNTRRTVFGEHSDFYSPNAFRNINFFFSPEPASNARPSNAAHNTAAVHAITGSIDSGRVRVKRRVPDVESLDGQLLLVS